MDFATAFRTWENVGEAENFFFLQGFPRRLETYFQRRTFCPTPHIFEITFLDLCLYPAAGFWLF